jgi:hypothetical protein
MSAMRWTRRGARSPHGRAVAGRWLESGPFAAVRFLAGTMAVVTTLADAIAATMHDSLGDAYGGIRP